jgi:hypothetical protein
VVFDYESQVADIRQHNRYGGDSKATALRFPFDPSGARGVVPPRPYFGVVVYNRREIGFVFKHPFLGHPHRFFKRSRGFDRLYKLPAIAEFDLRTSLLTSRSTPVP